VQVCAAVRTDLRCPAFALSRGDRVVGRAGTGRIMARHSESFLVLAWVKVRRATYRPAVGGWPW